MIMHNPAFNGSNMFLSRTMLILLSFSISGRSLQLTGSSTESAYSYSSKYWLRRGGSQRIHYTQVEGKKKDSPPVLLLNGFGVGFFHWERNLKPLAEASGSCIFAMDYLGQGDSWPVEANDGNAPSESGLRYSIDDWLEQCIEFIEEVVLQSNEKPLKSCLLVGNSLGGLLATVIASKRPDLVSSLALLNPTPLWGGNLPGWNARLPGPRLPRAIGRYMYDAIRNPANIRDLLTRTYSNPEHIGALPDQIRAVTDKSSGGHAAFASIMWARPATIPKGALTDKGKFDHFVDQGGDNEIKNGNFYDALRQQTRPTLLLYGAEDPWCSPEFGRAAMRVLSERSSIEDGGDQPGKSVYIELSPCGHCPHHEAPAATNTLLSRWIVSGGDVDSILVTVDDDFGGVAPECFGGMKARSVADYASKSLWELALVASLR